MGGASFQVATFASHSPTAEDFEGGWLSNHDRRTAFGTGEVDDPTFDTTIPEAFEDFEEEWGIVLIIGLVNDLAAKYEAHRVYIATGVHGGAGDVANFLTTAYPVKTLDAAIVLAADIRAMYEAHRILVAGAVHGAADAAHSISFPAATDWVSALALLNDMKLKLNLHLPRNGIVHGATDGVNVVTAANAWGTTRAAFISSQLDDTTFDIGATEAFEDFEEEWFVGSMRAVFGIGELDDPVFDAGAPEAFEDFEEEWGGNEGRRVVFGGGELDDAAFANGGGTMAMETYEVGKTVAVPAGIGIGLPTPLDITQANRVVFGGAAPGTLALQARRDGFATWETWDTITTVPATVDLPPGLSETRIERTGAGGVNTAAILWPILTEL